MQAEKGSVIHQKCLASNLLYSPICTFIRRLKFGCLQLIEGQFQKITPLILQKASDFPSKRGSTQPFPSDVIILLKSGCLTWISSKMRHISSVLTLKRKKVTGSTAEF